MIEFERHGLVGVVTIDRQERRNALNGELCAEGNEKRVWMVRDGARIKSQPIPAQVRGKFTR